MKKMVKVTKAQGTPRSGYRYDFLDGFILLDNNRVCIGYKGSNGRHYGFSVAADDMLAVLDGENKEE